MVHANSHPVGQADCDFAVHGMAVMGENLARNIESRGFRTALSNRSYEKVSGLLDRAGAGHNFVGVASLEELKASLKQPRKVIVLVRAGDATKSTVRAIADVFEAGDIIIDGGNAFYQDSEALFAELQARGIHFVGCGVSGGELGALHGPSMMPGGSAEAWEAIKPVLVAVAAKVSTETGQQIENKGAPAAGDTTVATCVTRIGNGGAGHFVKMVHNGIEYGDMQLIAEAYWFMKNGLGMSNEDMAATFVTWNTGRLGSFLIEITAEILRKKQEDGQYILDTVLDSAGQKGTGRWTAEAALQYGEPATLITSAVFARVVSAFKAQRVQAGTILKLGELGTEAQCAEVVGAGADAKAAALADLEGALYAAKLTSYAQGFSLLRAAATARAEDEAAVNWDLNYAEIAEIWRGGCIIRSQFLTRLADAFRADPDVPNALLLKEFTETMQITHQAWRRTVSRAVLMGLPVPALSAALAYFDAYRSPLVSANMIQAQRDYFGAHTFRTLADPTGPAVHVNWTGEGGNTASTTYDV